MGKYFGTDGFRGEANVTLTVEHAFRIGKYLGASCKGSGRARIVIGKDTRLSSYTTIEIAKSMKAEGMTIDMISKFTGLSAEEIGAL